MKTFHNGYKYCCDHCEYKGSKKDNLQYHGKLFMMELNIICDHCGYNATQKKSLLKHVRTVHDGVSMKSSCEHCDYKTK